MSRPGIIIDEHLTGEHRRIILHTPIEAPLLVTRFAGVEAISRLYKFQLDLILSADHTLAFSEIIGQPVHVEIDAGLEDGTRSFRGIITPIASAARDNEFEYFAADLRPRVWRLTQSSHWRVWQDSNVPQVLAQLFAGYSVDRSRLTETYPLRNYCVQAGETDFDFAARLMQEEGICFYFDHSSGPETLVLVDRQSSYPDPQLLPMRFSPAGAQHAANVVFAWERSQQLAAGIYATREQHFELTPDIVDTNSPTRQSVPLRSAGRANGIMQLQLGGNDTIERFEYPAGIHGQIDAVDHSGSVRPAAGGRPELARVSAEADRRSDLRMEQIESRSIRISGKSNCGELSSGRRARLSNHSDAGDYLITAVDHAAAETGNLRAGWQTGSFSYTNQFECAPLALRYLPYDRRLEHARVAPQTATVVGPAGTEIHTDPHGRVKVGFHWERTGDPRRWSCWLRVAHAWAGTGWGHQWIPRVGQEVIVDFLHGDPDQPIIVGSVYNEAHRMPWRTPPDAQGVEYVDGKRSGVRTRSTPGGGTTNYNEISFDDNKGRERVIIHAENDLNTSVENSETHGVGNDQIITVGHDRRVTVGHPPEKGGAMQGDVCELIWRDKHLHVMRHVRTLIEGQYDCQTLDDAVDMYHKKYTMSSDDRIVIDAERLNLQARGSITLSVGSSAIVIDAAGVTVIGTPLIKLNPSGAVAPMPFAAVTTTDPLDP